MAVASMPLGFIGLVLCVFLVTAALIYMLYMIFHKSAPDIDLLEETGFDFDEEQSIFFSRKDAWQKKYGYCRVYDEGAIFSGMVIDCEPFWFEYAGKHYLLELWKGQYGASSGCEIGFYESDMLFINEEKTWYQATKESEELIFSFKIYHNGIFLFERKDKHWWLTGFKLGYYAPPSELQVEINVEFKDSAMRDACLAGMQQAGYSLSDVTISNNSVSFMFERPKTRQPVSRIQPLERFVLKNNQLICSQIQEVTAHLDNLSQKIEFLSEYYPNDIRDVAKAAKGTHLKKMFKFLPRAIKKATGL